jgi:uncharacterized delta-60 repeat protein
MDDSFNGTGVLVIPTFGNNSIDKAYSVARDSEDRVLIGGVTNVNGSFDFAVARVRENGAMDDSWNGTGVLVIRDFGTNSIDRAFSVAVDSQDRVLIAGHTDVNGSPDFAVARVREDGTMDDSFNGTGVLVIPTFGTNSTDMAYSVAVDSEDRVLIGGITRVNSSFDFAVARVRKNGTMDPDFGPGTNGAGVLVIPDFGKNLTDEALSVAVDSEDRVLVGGYTTVNDSEDFAVARVACLIERQEP